MRTVVQRFAGAPDAEPVPVVRLHIVLVGLARCWSLPQVPIQGGRHGSGFSDADRLARVVVPALRVISPPDDAGVNLVNDLDGVW